MTFQNEKHIFMHVIIYIHQNVGADLTKYPNIERWYKSCASLPGADENAAGAKWFGERVTSRLEDKL